MIKDIVTRRERVETSLEEIHRVMRKDASIFAIFLSIVVFYIIYITSNIGA